MTEVEALKFIDSWKQAWQLLFMVCKATDIQHQAADNGANYGQWYIVVASGKGHAQMALINAGDSARDLSVHACVTTVAALAGEMTAICCICDS